MSENDLPPKVERKQRAGWITQERKYRLITPLFGGGVEPGKADPVTTIRGTEIRGQLRFWWRATRGGMFDSNLQKMRDQEGEIWGSSTSPSKVSIAVTSKAGKDFVETNEDGEEVEGGDPASIYSYVTFPLRESDGALREKITFTFTISFPTKYKQDIQSALWAWETFGGIGARTRRGLGAIHCTSASKVIYEGIEKKNEPLDDEWVWAYEKGLVIQQIQDYLEKFIPVGSFPDGVPHLLRDSPSLKVTLARTDPKEVWKSLLAKLAYFRQNRPKGKFGRSHWPEPDAIRRKTQKNRYENDEEEPDYIYNKTEVDNKFPRAAFGLPIIFEFNENEGDPKQVQLQPKNYDRLASPLILRPLGCQNGEFVGLALLLTGSKIGDTELILKSSSQSLPVSATLTDKEAEKISEHHTGLNKNVDVLQAFLDTF